MDKEDREVLTAYRLEQAKETIAEAELLIGHEKYRAAINRIYYGMFYALSAIGSRYGFATSKHEQLIGCLHSHCKKEAIMSLTNRFYLILTLLFILSCCTVSFAALPDTGQTQCYNDTSAIPCPTPGQDFYGQDGNYTINPPSYTKLDANGNTLSDSATSWVMIKDNVTGLIWENKTTDGSIHDSDNTYTWENAQNVFVAQLNSSDFGGYNDWRLPTLKELHSILDYSRVTLLINMRYFPNTKSVYWSSSTYAFNSGNAWFVNFYAGNDGGNDKSGSDSYHVRAVRGGQSGSSDNWIINNDGTVIDKSANLMWMQATGNNGQPITWQQALKYCENLALDGYTDWRMPNIRELAFLVDLSRYNPAIDPKFSDTNSDFYWSSSIWSFNTNETWSVDFGSGYTSIGNTMLDSHYVRCVRSRLSPAITSIAPNSGPTSGGTTVTITGTNFAADATVTFGGTAATITSVSATQISCITPAHAAGVLDVVVTVGEVSATLTSGFTYTSVPSASLSLSSALFSENGGSTTVTASLDRTNTSITTVNLSFGGTAVFGNDYTASSSNITIPIGQLSGSITLTGISDTLTEGNETVSVSIGGGVMLGDTPAVTATINDGQPEQPAAIAYFI